MSLLSKEDILKADDRETRDVDVPEWGGVVRVRELSGTDRDAYDASRMVEGPDGKFHPDFGNSRAKLVALSVVDEDGNLLFNELDVGRLGQKSSTALQRVADVAAELSGLTQQAGQELGKDSEPPPNDDSGLSSPNG